MRKCRCGSDLRVVESRRRYHSVDDTGKLCGSRDDSGGPLYRIECPGCGLFTGEFEDIADAWGSWNACQEILDGIESRLEPCKDCGGKGRMQHGPDGYYVECESCGCITAGSRMVLVAEEDWTSGEVYYDEEGT